MKLIGVVLIGVALGMSGGACATAQARTARAVPLSVPEPPPRAAIDPIQLPEPAPPERPVSRPAPAADTTGGRQGRPASATSTPSPPVSVPPAATVPAAAAPELQTTGSSSASFSLNEVRQMMARTAKKLDALDRRTLSAGKRADYDAARRFLTQAQEGVKANNVMLAQYSADKAETLVDGLR